MKTVGIMSMQRIYNYGSSLQAYGLKRLIEDSLPEAAVSFVDFRPGQPLGTAPAATTRLGRTLLKVREYNATRAPLVDKLRFFNHKRRYSRHFDQLGLPGSPVHDLDLDVQVIGSDEVFNAFQANTNVGYSRDLFGHGSPARRIVSYAASFGNTTVAKIDAAGLRGELAEDLSGFGAISVRDGNSADVVESLVGARPAIHVDPALAYDFLNREPRIPATRRTQAPYVIVYGYSGRLGPQENRALRAHADRIGARILTFGGVQECGDRFVDADPFELLAWFRDAEAVLTDTFHGTIFSIINHVPFATLVRPSVGGGYGNEEKLGHLLATFGLQGRRLDDIGDLASLLAEPVDAGAVDAVLATERERSVEYLRTAIGSPGDPGALG